MIKDFKTLLTRAKSKKGIVVGVPNPVDLISIKTVIRASKENIANFILSGERDKIISMIRKHGGNISDFEILMPDHKNKLTLEESSCRQIVELASRKRVQIILKGFVSTAALMKPILEKRSGLRTGNLLSDILIVENTAGNYKGFLGITDGGLNILPNLEQKKQIIENGVKVFHQLGYKNPKVGILAAVEKVMDSMPATLDAQKLTEMNIKGDISGCEVYGPLALDIAVSPEAAKRKQVLHPVAGKVQIIVVPNIESGNIFAKSFSYFQKVPVGHVVMGAKIPILIPSRNESENDKINSIALGVMIADN